MATSTMDDQTNSLLFAVPSEIRNRIFQYYLTFNNDDFADSLRPTHTYLDAVKPHSTTLPALVLACKRACSELLPKVQSTAALRVRRPGLRKERRVGFAVHGMLRLERLQRLFLIIDMDYPYWNAWLDFLQAVLDRARPTLEHCTIDWAPRPVTTAVGWQAKQAEKKDRAFIQLLNSMERLQTVWIYGQAPGHWKQMIKQGTMAIVKTFPYRWWKEPGME
ncbi:hypothetical protein SUNI508_12732 [Seiridium unicorne]|uniref:Uncharacterized protein n=1 Tax=Seiridium unicorne TaxID=138068 RepID=A0ABR2VGN1_9PEZI